MGVPKFPPDPSEWAPAMPPVPLWLYENIKDMIPFGATGTRSRVV